MSIERKEIHYSKKLNLEKLLKSMKRQLKEIQKTFEITLIYPHALLNL
jgi:hypothetical protein